MSDSTCSSSLLQTTELWRDVPGYEKVYEVSNVGRIRRIAGGCGAQPGRLRKLSNHNQGYKAITLHCDNQAKSFLVHRLMYVAFVGPIPSDREINHIDGNKQNNVLSNLELVTRRENIHHAIALGLMNVIGEANSQARVTEEQVKRIRSQYRFGGGPGYKALAKAYGLPWGTVRNIVTRRTWKHV